MFELAYSHPFIRAYGILGSVAADRARVYRWLALCFYPPDEALIAAVRSGQFANELEASTRWLGQDQENLSPVLEGLRGNAVTLAAHMPREYPRLFGKSVERVSPRESTYRWRDVSHLADAAADVHQSLQKQYNQFGLTPIQGMEDHLAVELEFLAFLCQREAACWQTEAPKTARELRRQESIFLEQHLGVWLPEFSWRVRARGTETFYGLAATLAHLWLGLDHGPGYCGGVC